MVTLIDSSMHFELPASGGPTMDGWPIYTAAFIKLTWCRKVSAFLFANMVTVEWGKLK